MILINILLLYVASVIVVLLHELGHLPKRIRLVGLLPPTAVADSALFRSGGVLMDLTIAGLVFYFKPELAFIQYIGAIAFLHGVAYLVLGSILPDKRSGVIDDIPNQYWYLAIPAALAATYFLGGHYWQVIKGVFI